MAIRLRKLAREIRREPADLLGILHALGYRRYRTVDDMLTDDIRARLLRAVRAGVEPELVSDAAQPEAPKGSELERLASGDGDLMGGLMRGVTPLDRPASSPSSAGGSPSSSRSHASGAKASRAPSSVRVGGNASGPTSGAALDDRAAMLDSRERTLELSKRRVEDAQRQVEEERGRIEALRVAVEQERASLQDRRRSLDALRAALDEERDALAEEGRSRDAAPTASLVSLLEARGLRGADEFERAIVGLARARRLQDVLLTLGTDDARALRRLLDDHLLLTGPHPPEGLAARSEATVTVAPDRAEVPDATDLARLGERLSDAILLDGWRSVRLVGGRSTLVRLLKDALDSRITLTWSPGTLRTVAAARADVSDADVVVLWGVDEEPGATALYDAARPVVVRTGASDLSRLIQDIVGR